MGAWIGLQVPATAKHTAQQKSVGGLPAGAWTLVDSSTTHKEKGQAKAVVWCVEDLKSTNGVFVNGSRFVLVCLCFAWHFKELCFCVCVVRILSTVELKHGDAISFGGGIAVCGSRLLSLFASLFYSFVGFGFVL